MEMQHSGYHRQPLQQHSDVEKIEMKHQMEILKMQNHMVLEIKTTPKTAELVEIMTTRTKEKYRRDGNEAKEKAKKIAEVTHTLAAPKIAEAEDMILKPTCTTPVINLNIKEDLKLPSSPPIILPTISGASSDDFLIGNDNSRSKDCFLVKGRKQHPPT